MTHQPRLFNSDTFRLPAEWERQSRVWLTRPHNAETWPACLEQAQLQFDYFAAELRKRVAVHTTQQHGIPSNDSWVRDYGPLFVVDDAGGLACHDFRFNSWGGKYPPWELDDAAAACIAALLDLPLRRHEYILEGGSIEVNGRGTVLTTEQCLLNPNRNPSLDRAGVERMLHDALGTRHVIWLPGGIDGDDTDGHIDDIARFLNPTTVAAAPGKPGTRDHDALAQNWQTLRQARDQDGHPLELVELPAPAPVTYHYPDDPAYDVSRRQLPASYANFLISNGAVFVPTFGQRGDERALRTLADAMPEHEVVPIPADILVVGLGALHCLSMQQPAV